MTPSIVTWEVRVLGFAISSTDSSGSSAAAIKLDINPVAWRQADAAGDVGDVTFVYVRVS